MLKHNYVHNYTIINLIESIWNLYNINMIPNARLAEI